MANPEGHVDVVYLPYLPLRGRVRVGDWELIARSDLQASDFLDARAEQLARGLADMYVLPKGHRTPAGAFARPREGCIGEDARDEQAFTDLRRACLTTVLDPNPSPLLPEDERDLNAGHWMLTTENATVVGHGINRDGYTGTSTGSRFAFLSFGVSILDQPGRLNGQRGEVPPPADLRIPTFGGRAFDAEYADAVWESVRRGDDAGRRLGRAIDWLGLASLNTSALTHDVRVPALRAGLEVLLNTGNYLTLARRLARLVKDESPKVTRTWPDREAGEMTTKLLSEVAWWSLEFSFLRNKLMHGDVVGRDDWFHNDLSHVDLADWYLRQAVKHTVAADGHAGVLNSMLHRAVLAAVLATGLRTPEIVDDQ
jgi:hypothetical protein